MSFLRKSGNWNYKKMEYRQNTYIFEYEQEADGVRITGVKGSGMLVEVPRMIDERCVTTIGKKAFLGCTEIVRIILPDTVCKMEDWAFASCKKLETISMRKQKVVFEKGVFRGCSQLKEIRLCETDDMHCEDLGYLFAAACTMLDAPYLMDTEYAGTKEWYEKWDARMRTLLEKSDREGFSKMLLCGVEDYGSRENTPEHYVNEQRKKKARIAFLRLRYPKMLSKEDKEYLIGYLLSHTKGQESEEAWEVLKDEYGEDASYYRMFAEIGGITKQNRQQILDDLGETHTQMKAFLLNQECVSGQEDFFDSLVL